MKAEELIKLDRLIEFDPYMRVGTRFLQRLYQEDRQNYSLTEDLLMEFSEYYPDKARTFENILFDQRRYVNILTSRYRRLQLGCLVAKCRAQINIVVIVVAYNNGSLLHY